MTAAKDEFVRLIRLDELPLDRGVCIKVGGRELAVFRLSDPAGVYAIQNDCPHAGASLAEGDVLKNGVVCCSWHAWKFRLLDGKSADGGRKHALAFPIEIRGEDVYVRLAPKFPLEFPRE